MTTVASLANKNLRTKVKRVNHSFVLPDTFMGVEVEVDCDQGSPSIFPFHDNISYWNPHHDGSLVNGYEYTLRMPLCGGMLSDAIEQLYAPPSQFFRTFTGSTHIHIDMLEEEVTLDVLRTMVLLVYILEPMLYATGDCSREWCGYANSLKSADPTLLSTLFSTNVNRTFRNTYRRGGSLGRYYGLNLAALTDYGSLEFRYFPTATSAEELVKWVNLVQSFKKAALEIGSPSMLKNIINDEMAYNNMLNTYFAPYAEERNALGHWRQVQGMLTKANITAQDGALLAASPFRGDRIFTSERFANVVTISAEVEPGQGATIYDNGIIPPNPRDGVVLIYNNRIYVRHEGSWFLMGERQTRPTYLHASTLVSLATIYNSNSSSRYHAADINGISFALNNGYLMMEGSAIPVSSEEEDPDEYEDDDEEENYV